jgi:5-methylcytosine-specific restriction endonuclease McrBC regulatory subunit McrC
MTTGIPIRNLYYLYAYAWDQFHFVHRVRTGEESGPDAAPFLAKILLQGCRQIFRRGVDRVYQTFDEELSVLRGRINVTKTLRRGSIDKARVWCEDKERLRSAHLYQLFAYLKNMERHSEPDGRAEGILLYPTVKEEVRFSVMIQGHKMTARTIDLAKPWKEIHCGLLSMLSFLGLPGGP